METSAAEDNFVKEAFETLAKAICQKLKERQNAEKMLTSKKEGKKEEKVIKLDEDRHEPST